MDLKTNSASTTDWVRLTQDMAIQAYEPTQPESLSSTALSAPAPQIPLPLQG